MRVYLALLIVAIACSACSVGARPQTSPLQRHIDTSPYLPWTISHLAPDYMEAYLVGIVVFDIQKNMLPNVRQGIPSMGRPSPQYARPGEWPANPGSGGGSIVRSDLPALLIVNWRSYVEEQEYFVKIEVAEEIRKEMATGHRISCLTNDGIDEYYRNNIVVGLAPGGIVKLWINGPCLDSLDAGRYIAQKISPDEARDHLSKNQLSDKTVEYLKDHPAPYGSW